MFFFILILLLLILLSCLLSATAMVSATADDALLPWLRSIRQIKQSFPNDKSKIFPFVADCVKQFQDDERYLKDIRFLKICIQYADCSPEPLKVIAELDEKGVGHDHALFYEAYATCLEAKRRFGDANNIYKRGLSRQAQPAEKLIHSYKLFRERMDSRKKRKQDQLDHHTIKTYLDENVNTKDEVNGNNKHMHTGDDEMKQTDNGHHGGIESVSRAHLLSSDWYTPEGLDMSFEELRLTNMCKDSVGKDMVNSRVSSSNHFIEQIADKSMIGPFGDETIQIRNFAAKAITGKEKDVEDAQHHGLVDPTVNTKEAIQYILSMFREPMDIGNKKEARKSTDKQLLFSSSPVNSNKMQSLQSQPFEFSVFSDSDCPSELGHSSGNNEETPFVVFDDERPEGILAKTGQDVDKESGFFVFKDDEAIDTEQEAFGVYRDDETFEDASKGKVLAEKRNEENSGLFVFRDEEPEDVHQQGEGKTSKGKSFGTNKKFPIGVENILPQSPLYYS